MPPVWRPLDPSGYDSDSDHLSVLSAFHGGILVTRPPFLAPVLLLAAGVGGCSAKSEPWPTASGRSGKQASSVTTAAHAEQPVSATQSASPQESRSIRPIPEVISKPRLFELPPSIIARLPPSEARQVEPIEFPSAESPATEEVRSTIRDYVAALRKRDVASLVSHWSESGESIDLDSGESTKGRESIGRVFASLFEREVDADVRVDLTAVRPIRDDVAIVDGFSTLACAGERPARSRFSAVLAKQNGRWLLESVREAAMPVSGHADIVKPLSRLRWLLGHWESTGRGDQASSTHCFWSARNAYLVRSHVVSDAASAGKEEGDKVVSYETPAGREGDREITEIIGWDPVTKSTRSWIFCSDGGFAEGTWSHDRDEHGGDRIVILVDGTLGDGSPASGTLRITRLGPDEVSCTVSGNAVERLLPPAGDFLRTARSSTDR